MDPCELRDVVHGQTRTGQTEMFSYFLRRHAPLRDIAMAAVAVVSVGGQALAAARPQLSVVELFTSQGCSSCPPANDNIRTLSTRPDVLSLSFGVTYWDQLGWKDTFASPAFTARQWAYARGLHHDNVFTPQVVVNGRADTVGQHLSEIEALLRGPPLAGPQIAAETGRVRLSAGTAPQGAPADVWLVRYEPGVIEVPVRRGENTGRTLPHTHVVRSLIRLGGWSGGPVSLSLPPGGERLASAVLVQSAGTGPILAAAAL
jgi:hypothetical protein